MINSNIETLCELIGTDVEEVALTVEELTVRFAGSVALVVSLRDDDYLGPEAINYIDMDGTHVVI